MRFAIIAIVMTAAGVADAGHHSCAEVSEVVGYRQCHRFGSWARGAGMWWELGATMLRFDPNPVDATATERGAIYHVTSSPGDLRPVTARGVRFRTMASFGAWYFGGELDIASITDGPQLVADVTSNDLARTTTTMNTGTTGFVFVNQLAVGRHARYGIWMFGAQLAAGARIATFSSSALPDSVSGAVQAWFVVDAAVKADVWLAPNFTLGATAGVDLVQTHDVSFAITLGAHLTPYDHTR